METTIHFFQTWQPVLAQEDRLKGPAVAQQVQCEVSEWSKTLDIQRANNKGATLVNNEKLNLMKCFKCMDLII